VNALLATALLLLSLMVPFRQARAEIIYSDFSNTNGLSLVGNVARNGSALRFGGPDSPMPGAAWYGAEMSVSLGFVSEFTFRMTDVIPADPGWGAYGNGLTFTVQDQYTPLSLSKVGTTLGYEGIGNSIAVAFMPISGGPSGDTAIRFMWNGDPGTAVEVLPMPPQSTYPDIADGETHTAKIVYDPYTYPGLLVYLDDLSQPAGIAPFHLTSLMGPGDRRAYVGFTAGNLVGDGTYDILSWRAKGVPEPGTLALVGAVALGTAVRHAGARRRPPSRRAG